MARRTRDFLEGLAYYVSLAGNNGEDCFFDQTCFGFYLDRLMRSAAFHGVLIHSYVVLPTRVLFVATPKQEASIPGMMKSVNTGYAYFLRASYGRTGTVWGSRYKSSFVQADEYFLELQKYIELLPVYEGLVIHPGQYEWSSYVQNSLGPLLSLTPHLEYLKLGSTLRDRGTNYREFLTNRSSRQDEISELVALGHPAAALTFQEGLELASGKVIVFRKGCGRPRHSECQTPKN